MSSTPHVAPEPLKRQQSDSVGRTGRGRAAKFGESGRRGRGSVGRSKGRGSVAKPGGLTSMAAGGAALVARNAPAPQVQVQEIPRQSSGVLADHVEIGNSHETAAPDPISQQAEAYQSDFYGGVPPSTYSASPAYSAQGCSQPALLGDDSQTSCVSDSSSTSFPSTVMIGPGSSGTSGYAGVPTPYNYHHRITGFLDAPTAGASMPTTGVHTSPYGNVTSTGQPMYRTTIAGASDNQMAGWQNSPQSCPQSGPNTMEWNMANTSVIYSPQSSVVTAYQSTPTSSGPFSYPVMPPLEMPHAVETHSPAVSDLSHCSGANVQSLKTLLFSSLPEKINKSSLEGYCEILGEDVTIESVDLLGSGRAKATISGLTSEEISTIQTRTHKLKGKEFLVEFDCSEYREENEEEDSAEGKCTIEVQNLPIEFEPELVEMYFEKSKTGGSKGCVQKVEIVGPGIAHLTFSTPEVAANILAKGNHSLVGKSLKLQYVVKTSRPTEGKCTIEVQNLPAEFEPELVEMYFEKSKAGGSEGCVQKVEIAGPGIAHVIFNTPEVAAKVLARENHTILGKSLKLQYMTAKTSQPLLEYETNKLLLKNIPTEVDEDYLQLYLSAQLKTDDSFNIRLVGEVAVITFTEEFQIAELEQMRSSIQEKPIKKARIEAELYKVCSSIHLSNVTDHYSEEYMKLYFESKRSGGGTKAVKSVELMGNGEAVVSFESRLDADQVLKQSHTSTFGDTAKIEYNDELCIAKQLSSESINNLSLNPKTLNTSASSPEGLSKSVSTNVEPLLTLSIKRDTKPLDQQMEILRVMLDIDTKIGSITVTSTKETPAGWQEKCRTVIDSYLQESVAVENNINIPNTAFQDILGQLSNLQTESPTFIWKFGDRNTKVSIAGERVIVEHAKGKIQEISDQYGITTNDIPLSPQEFTFVTTLKLQSMKNAFPHLLTINPQPNNHSLSVKGTVKDVREFSQAVAEFKVHSEVPIPFDQEICTFVKDKGEKKLLTFIHKNSYPLAVHFSTVDSKVSFLCESNEIKTANLAVTKLKQILIIHKHQLPESFASLRPQLEDFPGLCQELELQNTLSINIINNFLVVVGFKDDTLQCVRHLDQYIKEKCTVEVPVAIEAGVWRLLQTHMQRECQSIINKSDQLEVICQEPSEDENNNFLLNFRGDKLYVEQIVNMLSSLLSNICKRNIEKDQPGTCKYFRSEKARTILDGIEARRKVIIEVTEADDNETVSLSDAQSITSKFEKKCTATLPNGRAAINVYIGDITEFSMADVIVNAANEDLEHVGGVAWAIANKGGPIIQSDSDNHVRKSGKVYTGNVWLTENVGKLPCKALMHAVGPRWSGGGAKEEALLRKVCAQTLKSCDRKYRSVAFPAISSGVYGFPIDKCADTMIKAFIAYSESHPSSTIREMNIVLYKPEDLSAFSSALQRQLHKTDIAPTSHGPWSQKLSFEDVENVNRSLSKSRRRKKTGASSSSSSVPSTKSISMHNASISNAAFVPNAPIKLHRGGLLDIEADAYVNSTNSKLDLSSGAVAQALLKAGGQDLQTQCTAKAPLSVGEVAVTGAGKIKNCQHVIHTVVPSFDQPGGNAEKVLRKAVRSCLEACSKQKVSSIAFPAIGTGNLHYPNNITAEVMVSEINSFFSANSYTSLSTVHLVIFMEDTYIAFQKVLDDLSTPAASSIESLSPHPTVKLTKHLPRKVKPHSQPVTTPGSRSVTLQVGRLQVSIAQGNITEEDTDAIVVPTSSNMRLESGGVARAILKKGGHQLQKMCDIVRTNIPGKQLVEGKVAITSVTGSLKSQCLFHIVFNSNEDKKFIKTITACLEEADKEKCQSISFPAIGTGNNGYNPQTAAFGMHKVIEQFKPKHVKQIRLVLYLENVYDIFVKVFRNPSAFETQGLWERTKYFFGLSQPESVGSIDESVEAEETFADITSEEVVIRIYGETETRVDAAEKDIDKLVKETFITIPVESQFVSNLSKKEVATLKIKAKELDVYIEIDGEPLNTITIKGNDTSVHKMQFFAVELLSEVEKAVKRKEEAEKLIKTIQWLRIDSVDDEDEYSDEENYEIENAYRNGSGKGTYRYTSEIDSIDYTIDFDRMEEIDHYRQDATSQIKRVDLLKRVQEETPKEWDKMPIDIATGGETMVHIVDLDPKSQEYLDVKQQFDSTMQSSGRSLYQAIVKIQRIQNPTLYSQYFARKKEMDKLNAQGHQNERRLFHGTRSDTCPIINYQGFNRSYCGRNATVYGKGVYFARDASYSASETYSPRDANGHKRMYLARVLTGEFTRGTGDMLVPPPKDKDKNIHITFNSVVDNVSNPGIFVVFQDAQNYPEYLIVFTN